MQALPNGPQAQVTGAGTAAATRIAASRLQVDAGELQAVSEAKVGDYSRVKVVHPKSGRVEAVDLDAAGREAPREKVEQVLGERRRADFVGKQEKELVEKVIGIQYGFTALTFLLFGFTLMMMMRWPLAYPGKPIPLIGGLLGETNAPGGILLPEFYNQLGAMHGTIMVFLGIVPLAVERRARCLRLKRPSGHLNRNRSTDMLSSRKVFATLVALVMACTAVGGNFAAAAQAGAPKMTSKTSQRGVVVMPVAYAKNSNRLYSLVFMYSAAQGSGRATLKRKGRGASTYSAYLVGVDRDVATGGRLAAVNSEASSLLASGQRFSQVAQRVRVRVSELSQLRGVGAAVRINDSQLTRLLGAPAIQAGRIAQVSDVGKGAAEIAVGTGAVLRSIGTAAAFSELPISVVVGGMSAGTAAGMAGAVIAAGAGGVAIGLGITEIADSIVSYANNNGENGSATTLSAAIYDAIHEDDDDQKPAPTDGAMPEAADEESGTNGEESSGDEGEQNGSGEDSTPEGDQPNCDGSTQSCDDQPSEDSDDEQPEGDDEPPASGTTLPPDMDAGTSSGALVFYLATGLAGNAAKAQTDALDIAAGGKLGVFRQRVNMQAILAFDALIGGYYLKGIERSLNGVRNRFGLMAPVGYGGPLSTKAIRNFGLVLPVIDQFQQNAGK